VCICVCMYIYSDIYTAAHCNTMQTHCNGMRTHCKDVDWCAMHTTLHYASNTLQHSVTHCNTLQHTATTLTDVQYARHDIILSTHCNTLQHTATYFERRGLTCNTYDTKSYHQPSAARCNTLQHSATHCNTLHRR